MADAIGDLLRLVERSELGARVPAQALELWALDCARRALGVDLRVLDVHVGTLRRGISAARTLLRKPDVDDVPAAFELARADVERCRTELRTVEQPGLNGRLALSAIEAVASAMDCARDRDHARIESTARLAREAFHANDRDIEFDAQVRRLLLRCGLLPSGDELLVRLDYAEARGALPRDPAQQAWLDAQRQKLMADDTERRLIVVIRHLEQVFLAEFEQARE